MVHASALHPSLVTARRARRRRQLGNTLIEVVIAGAVFSIGALGLLRLMYTSTEGTMAAKKITQASALARSKLDELQSTPYVDLTDGTVEEGTLNGNKNIGPAGTAYTPDGGTTDDWGSKDGWFFRSWTVTTDSSLAYKAIAVRVQWYDGPAKRNRSVSMTGGKSEL